MLRFPLCAFALFAAGVPAAHAYLDPGTGSILLQSLLATIAAAMAFVGLGWQRVKAFFASLFSSRTPGAPKAHQDGDDRPDR
jgi:hypothetical protein